MAPETAGLSYNGDLHTLACHDKGKAAAKNLALCHANATRAYLHAQSYMCPARAGAFGSRAPCALQADP